MKKIENTIWGIVLITIGSILTLNVLEITNINLLFPGWWTFIIIIPCTIGLITENDKTGNLIGLLIGILLLLCCQDILSFALIWKLMLPIILIIVGISLIFKDTISKNVKKEVKKLNKNQSKLKSYTTIFASNQTTIGKEEFKGANIDSIFGNSKFDLTNATIKDNTLINVSAIFGYSEIQVPKNINVKITTTTIFGGVTNEVINSKDTAEKTIYVNATCMFGGVKIK